MRTIKQLSVPQNTAINLPDGGIKNETDTEDGTPVVEEIYGDILSNNYKLLEEVGIDPTGTQDNEDTQYQIAIKESAGGFQSLKIHMEVVQL